MNNNKIIAVLAILLLGFNLAHAATKFTNAGSVDNTRHNMTNRPANGIGPNAAWMNKSLRDYTQVCVYCHTPHGANDAPGVLGAPLWNHTIKTTAYTNYSSGSLEGVVNAPGIQSRTCLSCHDGTTAIDSIINMPGSGNYLASQMTTQNLSFLEAWPQSPGGGSGSDPPGPYHYALGPAAECLRCHDNRFVLDFRIAAMSTDMRDDHPVGIAYPTATGPGTEFNMPGSVKNAISYFDLDGNGKLGGGDVRLYGTQVECASCHDPHGVPSAGAGSQFKPTFLRVDNSNSTLCLVCHIK